MGDIYAKWRRFALTVSIRSFQRMIKFMIISHFQRTVLLNANVAFLAIPRVDNGSSSFMVVQLQK